jgi:alpha/beta superfamily hydrolase
MDDATLPPLEPFELAGPAGRIVGRLELPADEHHRQEPRFLAVFGHPDPQRGGTMQNSVVVHGARELAQVGGPVARFDYRGVGGSEGRFGEGVGELEDYLAVAAMLRKRWPGAPLFVAAGFSFGALRAIECAAAGRADRCLAVAPPLVRSQAGLLTVPTALVLAGADELLGTPTRAELDARFADLRALESIDGAGHLFTGRIREVSAAIARAGRTLIER